MSTNGEAEPAQQESEPVLGRKDLLGLPEPTVHEAHVEGVGRVYMREVSSSEQESYEMSLFDWVEQDDGSYQAERNLDGMRAKYLVRVLCDQKGRRLFSDEEYEQLGKKRPQDIRALHDKALEINGLDEGSRESMRKNSGKKGNGASSSD